MNSQQIRALDDQYVLHTYNRFPVAIASGKGAICTDYDGKDYVDLTSGIGVNALGFRDPEWVAAVSHQAATLQHMSNLYYAEPCAAVAKTLCERTGMARVFFGNSGAEANEGMIKAARKYSFTKYGSGRSTILTLINSFHGRTVTTLSATGQDSFHQYFFPFTGGFAHAPANDLDATLSMLTDDVCAVMMEMIQGEGGVLPLDSDYVRAVAAACREKDILLLVDEVQTGVGRTGTLYSFEQFGIAPDAFSTAKALGGGLPIGAVVLNEKAHTALGPGEHGSTFGGNPMACAGAKVVLERMSDAFLQDVRKKGQHIRERALRMPRVTDVSGLGMMVGIALDGAKAADVVKKGIEFGALMLTAKNKVRLLPPLTIAMDELDKGLDALEKALS